MPVPKSYTLSLTHVALVTKRGFSYLVPKGPYINLTHTLELMCEYRSKRGRRTLKHAHFHAQWENSLEYQGVSYLRYVQPKLSNEPRLDYVPKDWIPLNLPASGGSREPLSPKPEAK